MNYPFKCVCVYFFLALKTFFHPSLVDSSKNCKQYGYGTIKHGFFSLNTQPVQHSNTDWTSDITFGVLL